MARLSKFSWGHSFYKMNAHLIKRYRTCKTHEDVVDMQERIQAEQVRDAEIRKREKRASSGRTG
jgi:pre-rRNA-processing protein TSR3